MSKKSRKRKAAARGGISFQIEEKPPTRAFVLHVDLSRLRTAPPGRTSASGPSGRRAPRQRLEETIALARAIDLDVRQARTIALAARHPATLLGRGKVEELGEEIAAAAAELVIVDTHLSPGQQRNLEKAWNTKVLDRTGLILEIFGRRARTREGRLQVELAHLEYQKTRLVRSWTHLERQRGGFGFMGGPGETQIEADRRLLAERIGKLKRQLEQVRRTRELHRKARRKVPWPVVALAGYTNAGKSTLFNLLSRAEVHAEDQLFATLDPTMRLISLPHGRKVILSDTVGFIADLPTMLVAAFRATLEEVLEADVILHVRDMTDAEEAAAQAADVASVLAELGVDGRRPVIEVWNKADLWSAERRAALEARAAAARGGEEGGEGVIVSAATGEGVSALLERIEEVLGRGEALCSIRLKPHEGRELAWLYRHGEVLSRSEGEGGISLRLRFSSADLSRAQARFGPRLHCPARG